MRIKAFKASITGVLVSLVLVAGAAGAGGSGAASPDPGFGRDGRTVLHRPGLAGHELEPVGTARLRDGDLVVALPHAVLAFTARGAPDRDFGQGGEVALPGGVDGITLVGIAVDRRGRILAAGTMSSGVVAVPEAAVLRLLPDGRLDPGFGGDDGILTTDLGLAPPVPFEPQLSPPAAYGQPRVALSGIAVDKKGRIDLSGSRAAQVGLGKDGWYTVEEAFLARLGAAGEPDPGFGSGGMLTLPCVYRAGPPIPDPGGGIYLAVEGPRRGCGSSGESFFLTHVESAGTVDRSFGAAGFRPLGAGGLLLSKKILRERSGDLLVEGHTGRAPGRLVILALHPDGSTDRGFGRGGRVGFSSQPGDGSVALDGHGRILVATNAPSRRPDGRTGTLDYVQLRRLSAGGRGEGGSGHRSGGARFGGYEMVRGPTVVPTGGDRAVVLGVLYPPRRTPRQRLALGLAGFRFEHHAG